jgi:hypothetical protein
MSLEVFDVKHWSPPSQPCCFRKKNIDATYKATTRINEESEGEKKKKSKKIPHENLRKIGVVAAIAGPTQNNPIKMRARAAL